ncbi:MAG: hypothetical protein WC709_08925 [Thermoleophilia bacterium]
MDAVRTFRLSKSRITAGLQCGKRLWLAIHHPELEVYSADTRRRFAAGNDVGTVARELYGGGELIGEGAPLSQALRDTEAALAAPGDVTLYEATFRHRGVLVRTDVLERRAGRYRMVEVKSATRLKEYHLQDIAVQAWVTEGAGVPLDLLSVAVIDTDFVYPGGGDYRGLLRGAGGRPGTPAHGAHPRLGARLQRAPRRPAAGDPHRGAVPAALRVPVHPLL